MAEYKIQEYTQTDLKQALNANAQTAKALDEAYRRGYEAGFNTTQS